MNSKILAIGLGLSATLTFAQEYDPAPVLNKSIWFQGTNQQVNTGGDCIYEEGVCEESVMGYWSDKDDRHDNGGSNAWYPYKADEYLSLVEPMIQNLKYLLFGYDLADPTLTGQTAETPYNFVYFYWRI